MSDVEDFAAAQAAEYATYVATEAILVDGARAYNPGDPVPASNVEKHGYVQLGVVRKASDPVPELVEPAPPETPQGEPVVIGDPPPAKTTKKKG
jgi:hypothetical protein